MQQKIVVDAAVGLPAASSWFWMQNVNEVLTVVLAAGGVVLVILRVIISWRELKRKK